MFRAQAAGSWSTDACCADQGSKGNPRNTCNPVPGGNTCTDHTAASDFLFRLQPGEPHRFLPLGSSGDDATDYQYVDPSYWPQWGGRDDLRMGKNGPPGSGGYCNQGRTYAGSPNEACGGDYNSWGLTEMETWYPVAITRDHFPGSQLLTNVKWGDALNNWVGRRDGQKWALCFSSFTDDATCPAVFHQQCDQYSTTVTVVRNSLGYTFGGYVRRFLCPFFFLLSFFEGAIHRVSSHFIYLAVSSWPMC